jgi:hypothetical protein
MTDKPGRNDLCPCGSGKKYKSCCLNKKESSKSYSLAGKRQFTAKLISGGGVKPQTETTKPAEVNMVDYNALMQKTFGDALHSYEDRPPIPEEPFHYLPKEETPL